ncbi:hypothetical protein [Dyadobacter frigoris]|uniref:Uncharacterized protein n=1 Tax=Dyadobacter frigoris TaxID=2576211 RepID=A0A4U6D0Q7_9BACT|nr:hypothetical protein [Dyadobacter frigoris]TKT90682.1 hypothetical protein FDK13_20410 [Dyadobacter frigoris]GLU51162.1 hypothetical protein Dfri01_06230 [Dyadobacter frigoris]
MNKILILTVLSMLGITLHGQQLGAAAGVPAALYSAYRDQKPLATASEKAIIAVDAVNTINITSSINTNVFKVAHKTVSGWMNEGSSAVTGALFAGTVTGKTTLSWSSFTLGAVSQAALPVMLVSFIPKEAEGNAVLNWQTTMEAEASHFHLERSVDIRTFETTGRVQAAENSTAVHTYYLPTPG